MSDISWATMIPLIGGSAIGCSQATGNLPKFHLSFKAFEQNENHLVNYWPNVRRIDLDESILPEDNLDFVNSVCPCAGLSQLNTSQDRSTRDSQNVWMMKTSKLVLEQLRPKVYWGENAPALYTKSGNSVREQLKQIAEDNGYSFSIYRTSTFKHGIPQKRLRTFYFFWDSKNAPIMNWYDREHDNLIDYLGKIPGSSKQQDLYNINNIFEKFPSYTFLLEKYGFSHKDFIGEFGSGPAHSIHQFIVRNELIDECLEWLTTHNPEHKEVRKFEHIKNKLSMGKSFLDHSPAFYNSCTNAIVGRTLQMIMHPTQPRGMSHREIMHLMGLPSDFNLQTKRLNDVAQNVPTCTARDMTYEVIKYLHGELEDSGFSNYRQDNIKTTSGEL
jgi:site-specific DNA-cytosine methylase